MVAEEWRWHFHRLRQRGGAARLSSIERSYLDKLAIRYGLR